MDELGSYEKLYARIINLIRQGDLMHGRSSAVAMAYVILDAQNEDLNAPELKPGKDAQTSVEKRTLGNSSYAKGKYGSALELYSWAISAAPPASEELKLAYGNRSAALLALGRFDSCLKDVERALALGCDDKLKDKLEKRRVTAMTKRLTCPKEEEDERSPFGPPQKVNPDVPCASSSIELKNSPEWGRHAVAVRDIAVGETVVYEEPEEAMLFFKARLDRCYECFATCDAMIPCEGCSRAMYCDEECQRQSIKRGHPLECPLLETLETMNFSSIEKLALHVALRARSVASSWEQFRSTIESCDTLIQRNEAVGNLDSFTSIYTLATNIDKYVGYTLFSNCTRAVFLLILLKTHPTLFPDIEDERNEDVKSNFWMFGGLILHYILVVTTNAHCIETLLENPKGRLLKLDIIGSALYSTLSCFNHSCNPNVTRVTKGKMTALITIRPITKGQQLFDSYGPHYGDFNKSRRRSDLKFQYLFECKCEACLLDWPLSNELKSVTSDKFISDNFYNLIQPDIFEQIRQGNKEIAISILPIIYKNINILDPYVPCSEYLSQQNKIFQCFRLFGNLKYLND